MAIISAQSTQGFSLPFIGASSIPLVTNPAMGNYANYLLPLSYFFGEGAAQDVNNLYIQKSSLPGLTPSSQNTAQSLFLALLLRLQQFATNCVALKVELQEYQELIESSGIRHRRSVIDVSAYRKLTQTFTGEWTGIDDSITPDNI